MMDWNQAISLMKRRVYWAIISGLFGVCLTLLLGLSAIITFAIIVSIGLFLNPDTALTKKKDKLVILSPHPLNGLIFAQMIGFIACAFIAIITAPKEFISNFAIVGTIVSVILGLSTAFYVGGG